MKTCARCGVAKALEEFYRAPERPDGLRPWCKACCYADTKTRAQRDPAQSRKRSKRWYDNDPEHARQLARDRDARTTEDQRARRRIRGNKWKTAWRDRNRDLYRGRARVATALWREKHPEKAAESSRLTATNRRAMKRRSGDGVSPEKWAAIVEVFGGVCAYCRTATKIGIDHFVPLIAGGRHVISNFVPACRSCNSSKKDRDPFDWMEARGIDGDFVVAMLCETRHVA